MRRSPAAVVLGCLLLTAACSNGSSTAATTSGSVPAAVTTAASSTSEALLSSASTSGTSTSGTSTSAVSTVAGSGTALPQLSAFVAGARSMDVALRSLSVRVNAGIDSRRISIDRADVATLRAITARPLVAAVPGGLPAPLLRATLLVYADLVSRRDAFNRWEEFAGQSPVARDSSQGADLLRCLGNGAAAAAHFAADVADLESLAAATATVDVAAVQAHASAEVAVRAALVEGTNGGCAECGGFVPRPTVLWPITWKRIELAPDSIWDGTIGTTPFRARYRSDTGWTADLDAC